MNQLRIWVGKLLENGDITTTTRPPILIYKLWSNINYTNKFRAPTVTSDVITASREFVSDKQQQRSTYRIKLSTSVVVKYICALKLNCSPAGDGIESEHLRHSINSDIPRHISNMLSLCLRFSVVPDSFANGLLIPIPKKAGCDTSLAKNWRLIIMSTTFSKLLEMYVLEESSSHVFSDLQFGFVPGRGTEMATALVNDVVSYTNTRGSTVYTCSLDAEGAFDAIPHCVIYPKTLSHIYKVGIQPILTYGCSAVNIDHKSVKCMDRVQGMLIKTALGLPKNRRNSPLLAALGIEKIEQLIKIQQLSLLRNSLISNSKARTFYLGMMRTHHKGSKDVSLLSRCKTICNSEKISLQRYIFDNKYEKQCKMKLKTIQRSGVVDSISNLLRNYNCDSKRLVNLLLKPY